MPLDQKSVLVTTHVHTDGPIPGPHSLLTVIAVAHRAPGEPAGTFTTNVRELPGATLHPVAFQEWRRQAEDWLITRRASRPPAVAMTDLVHWVQALPGEPVLVTDTIRPDYLFLYWYLQRFTGGWPFARTEVSAARPTSPESLCPLAGCRSLVRAS